MGRLGRATCTVHLISVQTSLEEFECTPRPQVTPFLVPEKNVYIWKNVHHEVGKTPKILLNVKSSKFSSYADFKPYHWRFALNPRKIRISWFFWIQFKTVYLQSQRTWRLRISRSCCTKDKEELRSYCPIYILWRLGNWGQLSYIQYYEQKI